MEIRRGTRNDIPMVSELNKKLFRDDAARRDPFMDIDAADAVSLDYFEKFQKDESTVVFLAESDGKVAGYLAGRHLKGAPLLKSDTAELESIFVNEEFRGSGIGTSLVDSFLLWAKERGAGRAKVVAYFGNESARRFYERHGFASKSVTLDMAVS
jgi:ribosomal protein S18 acetylase RimI-like enzyme